METIYQTQDDQQLLELLKQGDQAAFSEIYERYAPKVFLQVQQMLRDEETAKDLVQDLFITVWGKAANIKAGANLAGYLYIAAQNSVFKYIRKGRSKNDYLNSLAQFQDQFTTEYGNDYDIEILYELIEMEISLLPEKMKVIFQLSRTSDLSYKEIASQLGIAENTVRKQVSNALKIIRLKVDKNAPLGLVLLALMRH